MASPGLAPFYGKLTTRVQASRLRAAGPHLSGSVLDLGCGLTELPGRLPSYVGCDREPTVLAENRRRFPKATFVEWDVAAEEPPTALAGRVFDTVLMLAILEHLARPGDALARAASLLAPGGTLVLTTPHPAGRLPLEWGARLGLLSRHADEEHEDLLDRAALARAAESAGLRLREYRRFLLGLNQLALLSR
jgi:SAM-dependent methyltransferase